MLKAKRLTAQQTLKVVRAFCELHGPDAIRAAYHWPSTPTEISYDRAFAFSAGEDMVGWGGILLNPKIATDDEAALVVGVFPNHQRRGYRGQILDALAKKAAAMGADRASMVVYKSNEAHHERTMREAKAPGSVWVHAGDVWYPSPGYSYFVRELAQP